RDRSKDGMKNQVTICTLVLTLITGARGIAGEHGPGDLPEPPFPARLHPAGGWHPYGGGLLHWWDRHCFPRSCAPDDYARKPLPRLCWPHYPPFYVWGTPEVGHLESH